MCLWIMVIMHLIDIINIAIEWLLNIAQDSHLNKYLSFYPCDKLAEIAEFYFYQQKIISTQSFHEQKIIHREFKAQVTNNKTAWFWICKEAESKQRYNTFTVRYS